MDNFYELSEDTISTFFEIFNKKSFPLSIKFQFVGDQKQKELIKVSLINPKFSFLLGKEILVSVNEDIMNAFDDESITILMEQEIDKIYINIETGKMKLIKDIILTIIMIPFLLIGLGLFISYGVIHFTFWWLRRLKTKRNRL